MLSTGMVKGWPVVSLRRIWECHVRGHSRAEFVLVIIQPDLDSKNLFDAFACGLNIARGKFGFAGDLLNDSRETFCHIGINMHCDWLIELDEAEPGLWNIDPNPK